MTPERLIADIVGMGIRVYGETIVSPFRMTDSPTKDAKINYMIEKFGYKLADEIDFPPKLAKETEATA